MARIGPQSSQVKTFQKGCQAWTAPASGLSPAPQTGLLGALQAVAWLTRARPVSWYGRGLRTRSRRRRRPPIQRRRHRTRNRPRLRRLLPSAGPVAGPTGVPWQWAQAVSWPQAARRRTRTHPCHGVPRRRHARRHQIRNHPLRLAPSPQGLPPRLAGRAAWQSALPWPCRAWSSLASPTSRRARRRTRTRRCQPRQASRCQPRAARRRTRTRPHPPPRGSPVLAPLLW